MSKKVSILSILNEQSKPLQESRQQAEVKQLNVTQILPNENNFYDTSNVEDLKASIEVFGIIQPLLVKKIDVDKYKVIAGHRRLISARQLYESGKTEFEHVPCLVETDSDSIKEKILLIHTNSTTRELSDWEKVEQLAQLKELFTEFKKTHSVPGRIRDLLADTLQVSPSAAGRMETVDKNLVPEFKEELKAKNISMNTAVELAKLPESKQKEVLKSHKGKIKAKDVAVVQTTLSMQESSSNKVLYGEYHYDTSLKKIKKDIESKITLHEDLLNCKEEREHKMINSAALDIYSNILEFLKQVNQRHMKS